MGIGKTDNYKFYEGYEDEPEVEISADNMETLHIWDGFIMDIFCEPTLDGKGGTVLHVTTINSRVHLMILAAKPL